MSKQNKTPVSGTGEWAAHVFNIQNGCEHDCRYCYAKTQAIRFGKNTAEGWKKPVIDLDVLHKTFGKKTGTIMFPTTHDITPDNIYVCTHVLLGMLKAGNKVLIVSKPHLECIRHLCKQLEHFKSQVLFRFTIGSADNNILKFWEPKASDFIERVECLKHAFNAGFQTSVSCEPMLDDLIHLVVETTRPWVTDAIWLGKPNKLKLRTELNSSDQETQAAADMLLSLFTDEFIWDLYRKYKDDPMIKWKDSIKQVVGLERSTVKGLDK